MRKVVFSILFLISVFSSKGQNCVASFGVSGTPAGPFSFQFLDSSFVSPNFFNDSVSYSWLFGDGNASTLQNPVHTYSNPGSYPVCLYITVSDKNSGTQLCLDSVCQTVSISSNCYADFLWQPNGLNPLDITFMDLSFASNPGGSFVSNVYFDFGDGSSSSLLPALDSVTHTYNSPGAYDACVYLTVLDTNGALYCEDSLCQTLVVGNFQNCHAGFTWLVDSADKRQYTFVDTSANGSGGFFLKDSVVWDFGDGNNGYGDTAMHLFAQSGNYEVCQHVYVLDPLGNVFCKDSVCQTIVVAPNDDFCEVSYIIDTINSYAGVVYLWNVVLPLNKDSTFTHSFSWDFGDGNTSSQPYPTHHYAHIGAYEVCVTLTSTNSFNEVCNTTFCDSIIVDASGKLKGKNGGFTLNVLNPETIGLSERDFKKMELYPNPANELVYVEIPNGLDQRIRIELHKITGEVVFKEDRILKRNKTSINLKEFSNGLYIISIDDGTSVFRKKLKINKW